MRHASCATPWGAKTVARLAMAVAVFSQMGATSIADNSTIFSFGVNEWGQTGLGTDTGVTEIATPIDTTNLGGETIIGVATGWYHSFVLSDDGTAFAFGYNNGGGTGLGTSDGGTPIATPIDMSNLAGKNIAQVDGGWAHSLLLADDGTVYSVGLNAHGMAGLGVFEPSEFSVARPIDTSNLGGRRIKQVSAGNAHNLLLADDGTVFSFGNNEHGQLGLGTDGEGIATATPIDTRNLAGKTITEVVAAGGNYSLLLADDGTVFSFGLNISGQTGLGTGSGWTRLATPIITTNLAGKTIAQISASGNHSLLLADDGTVFGFGYDAKTGVGPGVPDILIATPIDTTNLAGKRIAEISAGGEHSLLLADDGTVFSFGANVANGIGTASGWTHIATPIDMTNIAGLRVTDISAGTGYSLLLAVNESPLAGDYNGNGLVEQADLDLVLTNWGGDGAIPPDAWVNDPPSGIIDQAELDGVLANWGRTAATKSAAGAIPEPSAVVLLVVAIGVGCSFSRACRVA